MLPDKDLLRKVEDKIRRRRRVFVRTARIAVGFVIGVLSLWPLEFAFKTLEQPFASLSPLNLIVTGIAAVLGIAAVVWAPRIAFGEGGSRAMLDAGPNAKTRAATGRRSSRATSSTIPGADPYER